MKKSLVFLSLFAPLTAVADLVTDLTDTYTGADPPAREEGTPSKMHGLLGAAVFNVDKIVGEKERKTGILPLLFLSYDDTILLEHRRRRRVAA